LQDSIHIKEVSLDFMDTPLHFHNAYEMVWMQESSGHRIVGDNIEKFTAGDLVIMGPDLPHVWYNEKEYYLKDNRQQVKAIVTYFRPDWLTGAFINSAELTKLRELLVKLKRGIKITGRAKEKITRQLEKLPASTSLKRIIRVMSILNILSVSEEYECLASSGYINSYSQKDVEKIDKVYQYVMTHYTGKIMLEDAANIANMTPTSFCKYFKNRTQKTFSNFVNEIRIGYACQMLCEDGISISEICYRAGFNNLTNFNRNFKLFTKTSPTDFRNSLRL
ncbi:MAG: helix-turn-helix domain-containing protein, partial [Sphingobacteriales bacterium]